jgi:hypothetical protein
MIVYKNYATFILMGKEINIISEEFEAGRNTVAEIDGMYHYIGDEYPSIGAAVFIWQELNNRLLSNEELRQVMIDNNLLEEVYD